MIKQNNKLNTKTTDQQRTDKNILAGSVVFFIIAITPFLFYSYKSFPETTIWETSFFSFDTTFYADGQLSPAIELEMRTAELGYVFGPYEEDNSYKLAKLNARRGDSVQVAIISIAIDASEETANEIYTQASEMAVAKDMDGFETLADEKNIALTAATVLEADRSIAGLGEARNLFFWTYNSY